MMSSNPCTPCIRHVRIASRPRLAISLAVLVGLLATATAPGQKPAPAAHTTPAQRQAFEVASIRLNPSTECCTTWTLAYPANRFTASKITLKLLTAIAYGIDDKNMTGSPGWFDSQRYDISAKVEGDGGISREQMQPLIQDLLEQRFHLAAHREQKMVPGYGLFVTKGGFKLKPNKKAENVGGDTRKSEEQPHSQILANELRGWNVPFSTLASLLRIPAGEPVVDKTGIAGDYDIKLNYTTAGRPNENFPDLFTAVQEQLGLKLVPEKVPVDFLVIDHVDKIPTEN